jgi:hypothetical protein
MSPTTRGLLWFSVALLIGGLTLMLRGTGYQLGGVVVTRRMAGGVALLAGVLLASVVAVRMATLA